LAHELGIAPFVDFRGYVNDEELLALYAAARAVYYAPFDEDYGFTTIQAMAAARPVITTSDAGGTLEFVRHNHNGLIAQPTPTDIAAALDRIMSEPDLAQQLGQNGPTTVAQITWDGVVGALLG
jgi:glycosyltransferase involved in cell wall biosynthesis